MIQQGSWQYMRSGECKKVIVMLGLLAVLVCLGVLWWNQTIDTGDTMYGGDRKVERNVSLGMTGQDSREMESKLVRQDRRVREWNIGLGGGGKEQLVQESQGWEDGITGLKSNQPVGHYREV